MNHYKDRLLACDFFTVETFFLQTVYVFFWIEVGSRRVDLAGCTKHLNSAWVNQQAGQVIWNLDGRTPPIQFLSTFEVDRPKTKSTLKEGIRNSH